MSRKKFPNDGKNEFKFSVGQVNQGRTMEFIYDDMKSLIQTSFQSKAIQLETRFNEKRSEMQRSNKKEGETRFNEKESETPRLNERESETRSYNEKDREMR